MNKIYAIIASLAVSGVAAAGDTDVLELVQIDAATRKWETPVTVNVGGFIQTRYTYSSGGGTDETYGFGVLAPDSFFLVQFMSGTTRLVDSGATVGLFPEGCMGCY